MNISVIKSTMTEINFVEKIFIHTKTVSQSDCEVSREREKAAIA